MRLVYSIFPNENTHTPCWDGCFDLVQAVCALGVPAPIVRGSIPEVAGMLAVRVSSGAWLYITPEVVVFEIGAVPSKVLAVCLLYGSIFLCQLYRPRTDIINCYEKRNFF